MKICFIVNFLMKSSGIIGMVIYEQVPEKGKSTDNV